MLGGKRLARAAPDSGTAAKCSGQLAMGGRSFERRFVRSIQVKPWTVPATRLDVRQRFCIGDEFAVPPHTAAFAVPVLTSPGGQCILAKVNETRLAALRHLKPYSLARSVRTDIVRCTQGTDRSQRRGESLCIIKSNWLTYLTASTNC